LAITLKLDAGGQLKQIAIAESVQADLFERRNSSGDLAVGSGLGGGEFLKLGSATSTVKSLGVFQADLNALFSSYVDLADIAAPANPGASKGRLYKKTGDDGIFWKPDAGGAEVDLTNANALIRKNSTGSNFSQPRINLIESPNIKITVANDGVDNEIDVTIALYPLDAVDVIYGPTTSGDWYTAAPTNVEAALDRLAKLRVLTTTAFSAGTPTFDFTADKNWHKITLTGNITAITLTAPRQVGTVVLEIVQDGTGGWTIATSAWPPACKWAGGVKPVFGDAAGTTRLVTAWFDGTNYHCEFRPETYIA